MSRDGEQIPDARPVVGTLGARVEINDVEYYYELAPDADLPDRVASGALIWAYDGQAVFRDEVPAEGVSRTWVVPESIPGEDDPDAYFGVGVSRRVDRLGRRWILEEVDTAFLADILDDYDAAVEEMFGGPEVTPANMAPRAAIRYRDDAGEQIELTNTSWSRCYCADSDDVGYVVWNHSSDDLDDAVAPAIDRNRKIVWKASGSGSATVVDPTWGLTAAHIVTDSSGDEVDPNTLTWCTLENLDENTDGGYEAECFGTDSVEASPGWAGGSDPVTDYAVVEFEQAAGVGWFAISQATDSYISGFDDNTAGYQRRLLSCGTNTITNDLLTTHDSWNGRDLRVATGDVQGTPAGEMRYDTSTALGMSGGLHFYCPNGPCPNGHFLTGVQTNISQNTCSGLYSPTTCLGNGCAGGFSHGPKGSDIRTWVVGHF